MEGFKLTTSELYPLKGMPSLVSACQIPPSPSNRLRTTSRSPDHGPASALNADTQSPSPPGPSKSNCSKFHRSNLNVKFFLSVHRRWNKAGQRKERRQRKSELHFMGVESSLESLYIKIKTTATKCAEGVWLRWMKPGIVHSPRPWHG